jgi:hypothetical protein
LAKVKLGKGNKKLTMVSTWSSGLTSPVTSGLRLMLSRLSMRSYSDVKRVPPWAVIKALALAMARHLFFFFFTTPEGAN